MSLKEKLDLRFLLPVFTTTLGMFVFLHFKIIELTTSEPANDYLLVLSFCHYLSMICSVLTFVVLANEGICYLSIDKRLEIPIIKRAENAQKNLLFFWPFLLVYSVVSLVIVKLFSNFSFQMQQILNLILSIVLTVLVIKVLLGISLKLFIKMLKKLTAKVFSLTIIGYFFFVGIEVLSSSGVLFESERKFYIKDETVRLEIRPKGYVFLPYIKKVDYGLTIKPIKRGSDYCYYFNLLNFNMDTISLVEVVYKLQIFNVEKSAYFNINVSPK